MIPFGRSGSKPPALSDDERRIRDAAASHVDTLAGLIGSRHAGRPSSIEAAAAYVERQWREMRVEVIRETYPTEQGPAVNLIVEHPGTSRADEIVILGAHYDTVPETPGADDNASAVAGLLEASRLLTPRRFKRTIRFITFANEEPPHFYTDTMGSQVHARRCREQGEHVAAMVCLEMIGYFDPTPGSQRYPVQLPRLAMKMLRSAGDFLSVVGNPRSTGVLYTFRRGFKRATRLPLIAVPLPEAIHDIRLSDHGPFWDEGFKALMVTDTSFYRNPHYHQGSDTPDTLDYDRLTQSIVGIAGGVGALAGRA